MEIRVVLVEPEHDINVGYCCRAMRNFGFRELVLVSPKCPLGFEALMYSKHGADVLKAAKKVRGIGQAVEGCSLVVGTTGIARRGKGVIRNPMSIAELAKKVRRVKGKVALLLGREGMGLTPEEIRLCDFLATVEADGSYPVLNLSHALAIMLYELRGAKGGTWEGLAPRKERQELVKAFGRIARRGKVRDPAKITAAFRNVVERALVSSLEARSMLAGLKDAETK
ncbi:SpoU rRNA Methylase family protein [Candidatus Burarchaeum australiense]|nr:SpoU rRNA Methylase family protein [Candidatus Burarchaeum australiense]